MNRWTLSLVAALASLCTLSTSLTAQKGGTPPPNPEIAYAAPFTNPPRIQVMNADGSNVRTVVEARNGFVRRPGWSPDGQQLVFNGKIGGTPGIYVVNLDGTGLRLVTATNPTSDYGNSGEVDWSRVPTPDGRHKILFTQGLAPKTCFVVNLDGSGLQQVPLPDQDSIGDAIWNRTCDGIYMTSKNTYVADTLSLVLVTAIPGGGLAIAATVVLYNEPYSIGWMASGNQRDLLTYQVHQNAVFVLDLPSAVARQVTAGPGRCPSFSPNDSKLVFLSDAGICTINADGSGQQRISARTLTGFPTWKR